MAVQPLDRPTARVVILDDGDHVLLFRYEDEETREPCWALPGGGLEQGESYEDAARRELHEEVGLDNVLLEPCNWHREKVWRFRGRTYRWLERYFLMRVAQAFPVDPPPALEDEFIHEARWWSVSEIEKARVQGVVVYPLRLPGLLRSLIEEGPPAEPLEID